MIYYIITRWQDGDRYFFKWSGRINGVRIAMWSRKRVLARKFIQMEEARKCIDRDRLSKTSVEGPGAQSLIHMT